MNVRSQITCESIGIGATVRSLVDLDTLLGEKCSGLVGIRYNIKANNNPPKRLYMILTDTLPTGKTDANLGDFLGVNDQIFTLAEGLNLAASWESNLIPIDEIKQSIRKKGFKYIVLIGEGASNTDSYDAWIVLYRSTGVDKRVNFVQSA